MSKSRASQELLLSILNFGIKPSCPIHIHKWFKFHELIAACQIKSKTYFVINLAYNSIIY